MKKNTLFIFSAIAFVFSASSATAFDAAAAKTLYESKIKSWVNNPVIINAIKAQNEKHTSLTQADIEGLDAKWKAGDTSVIDPVLNNEVSKYLKDIQDKSGGLYTEIFVVDNKGLNVGESEKTSDYWQGDEAKFQETYPKGVDAMNIGEVEFDESAQVFQSQLSVTVSDGTTPVGAITVGIDTEKAK